MYLTLTLEPVPSFKSHESREVGGVSFQRERGLRHHCGYPQPCGTTKMAVLLLLCGVMTLLFVRHGWSVTDGAWDFHWVVPKSASCWGTSPAFLSVKWENFVFFLICPSFESGLRPTSSASRLSESQTLPWSDTAFRRMDRFLAEGKFGANDPSVPARTTQ